MAPAVLQGAASDRSEALQLVLCRDVRWPAVLYCIACCAGPTVVCCGVYVFNGKLLSRARLATCSFVPAAEQVSAASYQLSDAAVLYPGRCVS
jgi:hypothetical protein